MGVGKRGGMKSFEQPDVRPIAVGRYRLQAEYGVEIEGKGARIRIVVPAGFEHDGASVPRLLWSLTSLRPDGLIRSAALVHDFIYRHRGRMPRGSYFIYRFDAWVPCAEPIGRDRADGIFRRLMALAGIAARLVWIAWSGVRMGGWLSWRRYGAPDLRGETA